MAAAAATVCPSGRKCGGGSHSNSVSGEFQGSQGRRQQEIEIQEKAKGSGNRQRSQKVKDERLQVLLSPRVLGSWKTLRAEGLI